MRFLNGALLGLVLASCLHAAKTVNMYFVDVEGGQATLIVTPSKQSILVDSGWPGFNGRDADRIAQTAKKAGVKQIDYLIVTHYHTDHAGGVPQLVERIPVKNFVDHGPNIETGRGAAPLFDAYLKAAGTGKRIVVKPGDSLPVKDVKIEFLTANAEAIAQPLKGAGETNPLCGTPAYKPDPGENGRSVGFLLTFNSFKFLNLGDLTSLEETELMCPVNRIGTVDLYLVTHHGADTSNSKEIVHAIQPRVAIMNNGARKGGSPSVWQTVRSAPRLEDLWQLHFAVAGGKESNSPDTFIANLDETCEGKMLHAAIQENGSFTVQNMRNAYTKTYAPGAKGNAATSKAGK